MRKYAFIRIFLWIIAGTAFGFLLISRTGEDWLRQYPIFGEIINGLLLPAMWLTNLWVAAGLGSHGDAGFVIILIFMVGIWSIYGLLLGLFFEWIKGRRIAKILPQQPIQELNFTQSFGCFVRQHKALSMVVAILLVAVCCYCIVQKSLLTQDRKFFLEHINRKAVAKACLDILTQPEKYSPPIGSPLERDPVHNPNLPDVIRQLQPKFVGVRGNEVVITKNNYSYLTFRNSYTDTNHYDLIYQKAPSSSPNTETVLYSIDIPTHKGLSARGDRNPNQ